MGHIMDRDDAIGRELGLCTDIEHVNAYKGCTVAMADDLAEKITEARQLLAAVADEADAAASAWDAWTDYDAEGEHGSVAERVKLEWIARAARILADPNTVA